MNGGELIVQLMGMDQNLPVKLAKAAMGGDEVSEVKVNDGEEPFIEVY